VLERIQQQLQKKLDENLLKLDTHQTLLKENYLLLTGLIKSNGKEIVMPKVGGKHYAYTKAGMKKAKAAAKKTGKKVKYGSRKK
jgi:hypothetical protein